MTSYIQYLIPRIFNNYKKQVGVVSGRVLQSVSFLKTWDKLCGIMMKITAYTEYLMHGIPIFNNK